MNLFLLLALPLAAVAAHRFLYPGRNPFQDTRSWILGAVWSILSLVAASFFGKWREFNGNLPEILGGLTLTDALLVPGAVAAAWYLTRPGRETWELGLWLSLAFTMAGIRDFAASSRVYDLTEYFLVPLDRILILLTLPFLLGKIQDGSPLSKNWRWWAGAGLLVLTGALFPALSFAGWGWTVWVLEFAGIGLSLWVQKKAAPFGSGPTD